jgi:hypothetical protein
MTKTIFFLALLFFLTVTIRCGDFLSQEPQAILGTTTFYRSESDALMAVNSIYDKLNKRYTSNRSLWIFQDVASPDTETISAEIPISIIDNFTFGTTSEDIDNFWIQCYEAITRANLAITYIPEISMRKSLKDRLIGEAKFLRGWFYFLLITTYGQVPLVLHPIDAGDTEALTQGKASFDELYNSIEEDFMAAEQVLPWTYAESDGGRVTKAAAKSYLAKAYLFQEKWQQAASKADEVILEAELNGTFELLENFRDATWQKNSKESIFEMQSIGGTSGWEDENEGNTITVWHRPACMRGWGLNFGTQHLANAFEPGDPRKQYTLLAPGETYDGITLSANCLPENHYALLKFMGNPIYGDGSDANASHNFIFMRLAELYLMKAEAAAELNNLDEAETALEKVRSRARNDALATAGTLPVIEDLGQDDLIEAIRHERHVELATEMKRLADLRRWGILAEESQADGKAFVKGKHEYFPIPQTQIDLSHGHLKQNDGY